VKVNYLNTGRCLDPGRYRVEVYVDGRLSGRAESDAEFGALDAANLRDLGTAVCHPAGWDESTKLSVLGFDSGFVSPDNSEGVYMFRYQNPAQKGAADTVAEAFRSLTISAFASIFPAAPQESTSQGTY